MVNRSCQQKPRSPLVPQGDKTGMLALYLYRNPRLLLIVLIAICLSGLSSLRVIPRMEDPVLRKRVGVVSTLYPGAGCEDLELQVAQPLERQLRSLQEVDSVDTHCRAGICNLVIHLADRIVNVDESNLDTLSFLRYGWQRKDLRATGLTK